MVWMSMVGGPPRRCPWLGVHRDGHGRGAAKKVSMVGRPPRWPWLRIFMRITMVVELTMVATARQEPL